MGVWLVLGSGDSNYCIKSKETKKHGSVGSADDSDCGNHHFDVRLGK